jgi:hypothetical protein
LGSLNYPKIKEQHLTGLLPWAAGVVMKEVAEESHCQAIAKHFQSCRDFQVVLMVQLKARGNGCLSHKHQEKPMLLLMVVQLVLIVEHYDYHPHKDNGAESFQGSVKQDILEPAP